MKTIYLSMAAVLVLGLLSLPGQARPGMAGPGGMDPMERIERMAEHLDLSAAQEEQISGIVDSARINSAQDRERQRQIRQDMESLVENFDEGRAQSLADELGQITARQTYSRLSTLSQVHGLLTPEQRAELAAMREKREERLEKWRDSRSK